MRLARKLLVPLTLLALVAAACGDEDNDTASTTEASAETTAAATTTEAAATTAARATTTAAAASTTARATTTTAPAVSGSITVLAATSLRGAFTEIGTAFSEANPEASVTFSFDGSSTLATQIINGAPADMFASADTANMDKITGPGLNSTPPTIFATNVLTIIVPEGNPKGITGVADLANSDVKVVLCADGVPCGTYARQILSSAGVSVTPVSEEQNVGGVVTKVTANEADAGIAYVTDVQAVADQAESVAIAADINVVAEYPIAALNTSTQAPVDDAFTRFLLSPEGQAILANYGFAAP